MISSLLTSTPSQRSGQVCFSGTRITVKDLVEYLKGGNTPAELVQEFGITSEEIAIVSALMSDLGL